MKIQQKYLVFYNNSGFLSSPATRIDVAGMYGDVSDPRSPILRVPGSENGLKGLKNQFSTRNLKKIGWVGGTGGAL